MPDHARALAFVAASGLPEAGTRRPSNVRLESAALASGTGIGRTARQLGVGELHRLLGSCSSWLQIAVTASLCYLGNTLFTYFPKL
jgi:hypothetical protein